MADMVNFRTYLSSEIESKEYVKGSILIASDTGEAYFDSLDGERIPIAKSIEYLNSDADRTGMLTPEVNVMYVVRNTGLVWIYNGGWVCINADTTVYFTIENVEVAANGAVSTISDSRVTSDCTAVFSPITALHDLFAADSVSVKCTCGAGSVNVTSTCAYPLIGVINVTKP